MAGFGNRDGRPKFSWGQMSRSCVRCGKNGPRIVWSGGWIHYYCMTPHERTERRKENGPALLPDHEANQKKETR